MKKFIVIVLFLICLSGNAFAALSIDSFQQASATFSGNVVQITYTNTGSNEIVVILCGAGNIGTPSAAVTGITDTGSHTWTKRIAVNNTGTTATNFEEWYTVASGTLSSDTISVTYNGNQGTTARLVVFSVVGANTTTPFDANGSLPASQNNTTTGTSASTTISTSNANDIILAYIRGTAGTTTPPAGFTQIGVIAANENAYYKIVSSTQSSVAVPWSWTTTGINVAITDAVQAPAVTTISYPPDQNTFFGGFPP